MPLEEIFPHPLVKQVGFEIRFPNLFFLEGRIGEFQLRIIKQFPESALAHRRSILMAEGQTKDLQELLQKAPVEAETLQKLWIFKSEKGMQLTVSSQSLAMVSTKHQTYNLEGAEKFRDVIRDVCRHFLEITSLPIINRIGLRYTDEGPLPEKTTQTFSAFYNTAFPLDRFPIESAAAMEFSTIVSRQGCQLRYAESWPAQGDQTKLILDYDAWAENVESSKVVETADVLHAAIAEEFQKGVKEPVLKRMRGQ